MSYSLNDYEVLSFTSLWQRISQEQVYAGYLGSIIEQNTKYRSPFRSNDSVPSLSFYSPDGKNVNFKDFGMNRRAGNVFTFVQMLYSINSMWEAAVQINEDFQLGLINLSRTIPRKSLPITRLDNDKLMKIEKLLSYKAKPFTERDMHYWSKFHVPLSILHKFKVEVADIVYINKFPVWFYSIPNPIYAYNFGEKYKFYRPLNSFKEGKFLSSNGIGHVYQGYSQLKRNGDSLILTKSLKDVMVLDTLKHNTIAPNGETYAIKPSLLQELQQRFKTIYLLLDNDWHKPIENNTGINAMKHLYQQYRFLKPIIIPDQLRCSDIAEVIDEYGISFTKQFLLYAKSNTFSF